MDKRSMKGINPATGETVETYDEHDDEEVDDRLSRAESTFEEFRDWPTETRTEARGGGSLAS